MKRLLIVDDEKNILKLYEKEFKEEGYEVVTASSGLEALQKISSTALDSGNSTSCGRDAAR